MILSKFKKKCKHHQNSVLEHFHHLYILCAACSHCSHLQPYVLYTNFKPPLNSTYIILDLSPFHPLNLLLTSSRPHPSTVVPLNLIPFLFTSFSTYRQTSWSTTITILLPIPHVVFSLMLLLYPSVKTTILNLFNCHSFLAPASIFQEGKKNTTLQNGALELLLLKKFPQPVKRASMKNPHITELYT